MWIVKTLYALFYERESCPHFRDDVGTTFVIAVMFLCRGILLSSLQTAEALELLYLQLGHHFSQGGTGSSTAITSKCPSQHT